MNLIKYSLKVFKHLFYDIIPQFYEVRWYKHEFDNKFEYYTSKPVIYLIMLIISLFDIEIMIYRIVFIFGFIKGIFGKVFIK